jgi:hypothetical protein
MTLYGGGGKTLVVLLTTALGPGLPVDLTWKFSKYAFGADATGSALDTSDLAVFMSNPFTLASGSYRMYFGANFPAASSTSGAMTAIRSATSTDGVTWSIESGYRLLGDGDSSNNSDPDGIPPTEAVVSGPRVVQLSNGSYRMYYQASSQGTTPPDFREKSATSSDGLHWTRETTIVSIGGSSPFSTAGHCYVLRLSDTSYVMFLTGNPTAESASPSNLYEGTSTDGTTFGNWKELYADGHDPFVIRLADGRYALFFGYLIERQRVAISSDGVTWPATAYETILLDQSGNEVTEASSEQPGDRSALLLNGKVQLFLNWGANGAHSSTDIVQFAPL